MSSDFGLFCNPESRRVEGFSIALGRSLRQRPTLIPWLRVLQDPHGAPNSISARFGWHQRAEMEFGAPVRRIAEAPRFLRLESPGRNWQVEKLLLLRGAGLEDDEASRGWRTMPANALSQLTHEPGRVLPMRQWYLGWRSILADLSRWADQSGFSSRWLCPPEDVACMFDKAACQRELEKAGIPVPPALGIPTCFDELWEWMRQQRRKRVFLKPCHGSSASCVVALETSRADIQAFSTTELVDAADGCGLRLYNQRRIQTRRGAAEVRRLVDAVCAERCLAQVWIPKAGLFGRPFDLRVVVIGRQCRNMMLRLGAGPMTNSQLLGGKGDVETLRQRMGPASWERLQALCEQAMARCFPRCLYAGFDVLVEPDFRSARILEVNAFGDLLPRILHEGRETYAWEVEAALQRQPVQVSAIGA